MGKGLKMAGDGLVDHKNPNLMRNRQLALLGTTALTVSLVFGSVYPVNQAFAQEFVAPGQTRDLTDGETVTYAGGAAQSAITVQNGATLNGTNATIQSNGTSIASYEMGTGIRAETNSTVNLIGGTVSATGTQYSRGILGGFGASITTDGTDISTSGNYSHAVHVTDGATALIQGGTVSTVGNDSFGLYAQKAGSKLTANNVEIVTQGLNGFGAFTYGGGSLLELTGGSITTHGESGKAVVAGADSSSKVTGTSIDTKGKNAWGLVADQANTAVTGTNVNIVTHGLLGYGAHAASTGTITLNGGSILTANETGKGTQDGDGARSYALYANGSGASITANGTSIKTLSQRSYGAYALGGSTIGLNDLSISTAGFMAYGVYASGAGSVVTANNVDITTTGQVGDAAWAYQGGRLELDGGTYHVQGERNPNAPGETANGLVAVGGTAGTNDGVINARGVTVVTDGAGSMGLVAGSLVGSDNTSGKISLTGSSVTVRGADAYAGRVSYGSTLSAQNSTLVSEQGVGIRLIDNATVTLDATRVSAGQETFVSNLNSAGQSQQITVKGASVATQNNGTLLKVNRTANGADGVVALTLDAGSVTRGDIIDEDARSSGGTDVTVDKDASWTGLLRGVRNFFGGAGGDVSFEGEADIAGDLTGTGTNFTFSSQGGQIGGDVTLGDNSRTTGGTIENRINVVGDVAVDQTSTFGGNWNIGGDLSNGGTLTPGNSIGRVSIAGDLLLAPTSIYAVDIDATGDADLVDVGGTATLAGAVSVTPLGGLLVGSPYTILTAGTLAGTFGSVGFAQTSDFLAASLSYDPNAVLLTIERNNVSFASVAATPNQAAAAEAIDQLPLTSALASAVAFGTVQGAVVAFDQVSGEVHASAKTALIEDSRHIRNAANDRIRAAFGNVAAAPLPVLSYGPDGSVDNASGLANSGTAAWGNVFGSWGSTDGDANTAELDRSTGGLLIGLDGMLDTWRVGALAGYSRSSFDVDGRSSSGDADNYHLGVYGGTQWGAVGFRTGLAYTWSDIDTQRSVAFPGFTDSLSAGYDAGTFQAFGELGYSIETAVAALEPFINLAHVNVRTDGFTETGGVAALSSARSSTDTTFSTLGLRASTDFAMGNTTATARGMIGWRHAFGDITPLATHAFAGGRAFTVTGAPIAKNSALIEAGLDFAITPAATLGVSYDGQFGSGSSDHGGRIDLDVKF